MCIWKHLARNNYEQRVLARLLRLSTVSASIWRRRDCKAESFHIKNHFLHARRKNWKQSTDLKQSIYFGLVFYTSWEKSSVLHLSKTYTINHLAKNVVLNWKYFSCSSLRLLFVLNLQNSCYNHLYCALLSLGFLWEKLMIRAVRFFWEEGKGSYGQ